MMLPYTATRYLSLLGLVTLLIGTATQPSHADVPAWTMASLITDDPRTQQSNGLREPDREKLDFCESAHSIQEFTPRSAGQLFANCTAPSKTLPPKNQRLGHSKQNDAAISTRGYLYLAMSTGIARSNRAEETAARKLGTNGEFMLTGKTRMAGRVNLGYAGSGPWLVEAGYVYLGELSWRLSSAVNHDRKQVERAAPRTGHGPEFAIGARIPIRNDLDLVPRLGIWFWESRLEASIAESHTQRAIDRWIDRGNDLTFGASIIYTIESKWMIRGGAERYLIAGQQVDFINIGLVRRFL